MKEPLYVLGHSAGELERLGTQSAFFEEITRSLFEKAGITQGMRVLDIGCGAGDVSFLAADMVGPSGSVLGVDRAAEPVAAATARAAERGLRNVRFRKAEIEELEPGAWVDALVGRFVLMHQADPARTLREAARHLRPGGVVAILESHMSALVEGVNSYPHSPVYGRIVGWMIAVIRAAGAHADMGLRLARTFADADLDPPKLWMQARVEGGPDAAIYRYTMESLRSMLPMMERLGIVTLSAGEIEALETQLREEVTGSGGVLVSPLLVGAWVQVQPSRKASVSGAPGTMRSR